MTLPSSGCREEGKVSREGEEDATDPDKEHGPASVLGSDEGEKEDGVGSSQ